MIPFVFFLINESSYLDGQVIPGIAGKDYPIFSQTLLHRRRFACRGLEGYFADISTKCQVYIYIIFLTFSHNEIKTILIMIENNFSMRNEILKY